MTYNLLSRLSHWIGAVAFILMLILGLVLEYGTLDPANKFPLLKFHKAFGIILLVYGIWRVTHRLRGGFPEPLGDMPLWQEIASKAVHYILLASILLMPITGVLMSLSSGRSIDMFGLFQIHSIGSSKEISAFFRVLHKWVAYVFIASIALHIGAALKHHFMDKDGTLLRMINGHLHN